MFEARSVRPEKWVAALRGLRLCCPMCGRGALFGSYLKLSERCTSCGETLGHIRADDGPAWATILVVGHIMVPLFLVAVRADAPDWLIFGLLLPTTIALVVFLLPRSKGLFAAVLWSLHMPGGAPE